MASHVRERGLQVLDPPDPEDTAWSARGWGWIFLHIKERRCSRVWLKGSGDPT